MQQFPRCNNVLFGPTSGQIEPWKHVLFTVLFRFSFPFAVGLALLVEARSKCAFFCSIDHRVELTDDLGGLRFDLIFLSLLEDRFQLLKAFLNVSLLSSGTSAASSTS